MWDRVVLLAGVALLPSRVLILLPPSEGKADAGSGRRLNPDTMSLPELRPARERVLDSLVDLCVREPAAALAALGLSAGQAGEVERNTRLREARTLPAARLYTGVLYDALDLASLSADAYKILKRSVLTRPERRMESSPSAPGQGASTRISATSPGR